MQLVLDVQNTFMLAIQRALMAADPLWQEITDTFLAVVEAIFGGIADGIVTLFGTLIYDSTTGLTDLATWMIIFMAVSFALTIFYALFRKVA